MAVWRIKLNSGRPDVTDKDAARAYCRARQVVGLGWGDLDGIADGAGLSDVLEAIARVPGWAPTGPRLVARLAERVADNDLIWTRDRGGDYWLGQITGGWYFDDSSGARSWDLANVRRCRWLPIPYRDHQVPGSVVRNFAGVGEALRGINQPAAVRMTELLWRRASDPDARAEPFPPGEVLRDLLDPYDVEDLVLIWLQARGWLLWPSTRMHDTPMYEAQLCDPSGARAVVSVKSGPSTWVPIPELAAAAAGASAYAYSTHDNYTEDPARHGVTTISHQDLLDLIAASPQLLPPRIAAWFAPRAVSSDAHQPRAQEDPRAVS